jgi:hypothetical protein
MNPEVVTGFITVGPESRHCERSEANQGGVRHVEAVLDCFVASLPAMTKENKSGTP